MHIKSHRSILMFSLTALVAKKAHTFTSTTVPLGRQAKERKTANTGKNAAQSDRQEKCNYEKVN